MEYLSSVITAAWRKTVHDVTGQTLSDRVMRGAAIFAALFVAWLYVRFFDQSSQVFSDSALTAILALAAGGAVFMGGLLLNLLFVAPYQLWREQKALAQSALTPKTPIIVHDGIFIDCDRVRDDRGRKFEDVYSIALCLWVTNGLEDGSALKNLQARYYSISGEWVILPIRGVSGGIVDVRHGEAAIIEIGRVLWRKPQDSNSIPAGPRAGGHVQIVDENYLRGILPPEASWRTLSISGASGDPKSGIGQQDPDSSFDAIRIILSADGVLSRYVRMKTNLFAERAYDWLEAIPDGESNADKS